MHRTIKTLNKRKLRGNIWPFIKQKGWKSLKIRILNLRGINLKQKFFF